MGRREAADLRADGDAARDGGGRLLERLVRLLQKGVRSQAARSEAFSATRASCRPVVVGDVTEPMA